MENDPVFARRPGEDLPMEKMRELTFLRYRQTEEKVQSLTAVSHLLTAPLPPPQGEAALPLRLPDQGRHHGRPLQDPHPHRLPGHV